MFRTASELILRVLCIPAEPHPPSGAPGSVRVFRAAKNYFRLRLAGWALRQLLALVGILFSVGVLLRIEPDVHLRSTPPQTVTRAAVTPGLAASSPPAANPTAAARKAPGTHQRLTKNDIAQAAARAPWWVWPLLNVVKGIGIALYLVQIPITYIAVRLEYEQRWYIVTDRSLRIREGLWRVQEITMSFANLQQVTVSQGPIQRLFRLADVQVQSAGGGSGSSRGRDRQEASLHTGAFHGVDNASEIRDLILDRLRQFRASGLGDPDDHSDHPQPAHAPAPRLAQDDPLAAAQAVLTEARALRAALQSR